MSTPPVDPRPAAHRPLFGAVCAAGLLFPVLAPPGGALEPWRPVLAHRRPAPPPVFRSPAVLGDASAANLDRFYALYKAVRAGDTSAAPELVSVGEALTADGTRPEAGKLARYYASLSHEALIRGSANSAAYHVLWGAAENATTTGIHGDAWRAEFVRLLEELEELGNSWQPGEDLDGPARALGLAAHLRANHAEVITGAQRRAHATLALERANRALELFEQAGLVRPTFEARLARARALRVLGRAGESHECFAQVLQLALERDDEDDTQIALGGLILLAREAGDVWARDRLLDRLTSIADPSESWSLAHEHALRLFHDGYPAESHAFLLTVPPPVQNRLEHSQYLHLLSASAYSAGDLADARRRLLDLYDNADRWLLEGYIELRAKNPGLAVEAAERTLEQELPLTVQRDALKLLGTALLEEGRPDAAFDALYAALDLASEQRKLVSGMEHENITGEWLGVETFVTLARALDKRGEALEAAVVSEAFQSERLRRALGTDDVAPNAEGLKAWAARYELGLVTWAVGVHSTIVVHVAQDGVATAMTIERGRRDVARAVHRLREAALTGNERNLRALGPRIAEELLPPSLRAYWEPVPEAGDAEAAGREAVAGVRAAEASAERPVFDTPPRLLLLPHGPLEDLPFECLWTGEEWLGEITAQTVLPGLTSSVPDSVASVGPGTPWLLLDASHGPEGFEPLPGAQREIEALAELHEGSRILKGETTSLDEVRSALGSGLPLHTAAHLSRDCGHASASFSPLGLALDDGAVLCTHRIAEWKPVLPLAVLSACGTAGGRLEDSEGVNGLARAFLESGTRNLLVTQWPVDDVYAARAALVFHAALEEGHHPSDAARITRKRLREEGAPFADWAAWRLLGRD